MPPRSAPSVVQVWSVDGSGMAAIDWKRILLLANIFRAKRKQRYAWLSRRFSEKNSSTWKEQAPISIGATLEKVASYFLGCLEARPVPPTS
eukprot:1234431-Pyramimonas_sp.AAC.1